MKIDFHCHTLKTKNDESETRNVTLDLFKEKILLSEVKIIAITNHNLFDKEQYILFKENVKDTCQVWPGIELDVIGASGKKGHLILISNPEDVELFSQKMNELLNDSTPDDFEIKVNELYEKVKDLNLVYVVHCFKKKELSLDDIEAFENIMINKKRLFKEPSSLTSITVLQSNKHRVVVGTDVIDWNKYEKYNFGEFKFEIKDFASFIKIIEKDLTFLKDLVEEELSEKVKVYGKNNTKEFPFDIPIYNDVNVIFGDKGSGKSEILESLKEYYTLEKNEEPVYYTGGDKEKWYSNLIRVNSTEYDIKNIPTVNNNETELNQIANFIDTTPTNIKNYIEYFKKQSKKASKDKMKCLLINKRHLYNEEKYNNKYGEYKKVTNFLNEYKNLNAKELLTTEENETMLNLLTKLSTASYEDALNEWYNQKAEYLVDDFATKIPIYVSENIGEPTPPAETGFASFAKNRLKIRKNAEKILKELNEDVNNTDEYIGNLGSKGKVYLSTNYSFINSSNKSTIDHNTLNHNKGDLQPFVANLENIKSSYASHNIPKIIQEIKVLYDKGIKSMADFISIKKDFTINSVSYKPSKGEKSILALQHELLSQKEKNVFLVDEPDLSLGSTYINEVIVPLFKDLSRAQKILVVATHDANVAVRTRPLNSILKITDNNCYKTYIGNMFTDKLVNIENEEDILSWKEQSIKYLEGGIEAFSERGDLYE